MHKLQFKYNHHKLCATVMALACFTVKGYDVTTATTSQSPLFYQTALDNVTNGYFGVWSSGGSQNYLLASESDTNFVTSMVTPEIYTVSGATYEASLVHKLQGICSVLNPDCTAIHEVYRNSELETVVDENLEAYSRHDCSSLSSCANGSKPNDKYPNCHCDRLCWNLHDCCADLTPGSEVTVDSHMENLVLSVLPYLTCNFLSNSFGDHVGFWMVSRCPPGTSATLTSLCETVISPALDDLLPVTSASGMTYKNRFCLQCHENASYTYWDVLLQRSTVLLKSKNVFKFNSENLFNYRNHIFFLPQESFGFIRACLMPDCSRDNPFYPSCQAGTAPVYSTRPHRWFKNIDCLLCHAQETSNTIIEIHHCSLKLFLEQDFGSDGMVSNLFDIFRVPPAETETSGTTCPLGEIYNHLLGKCITLQCPRQDSTVLYDRCKIHGRRRNFLASKLIQCFYLSARWSPAHAHKIRDGFRILGRHIYLGSLVKLPVQVIETQVKTLACLKYPVYCSLCLQLVVRFFENNQEILMMYFSENFRSSDGNIVQNITFNEKHETHYPCHERPSNHFLLYECGRDVNISLGNTANSSAPSYVDEIIVSMTSLPEEVLKYIVVIPSILTLLFTLVYSRKCKVDLPLPTKITLHQVGSLTLTYVTSVVAFYFVDVDEVCLVSSLVLHYSVLSLFVWNAIYGLHFYIVFHIRVIRPLPFTKSDLQTLNKIYCTIGYAVSAVFVAIPWVFHLVVSPRNTWYNMYVGESMTSYNAVKLMASHNATLPIASGPSADIITPYYPSRFCFIRDKELWIFAFMLPICFSFFLGNLLCFISCLTIRTQNNFVKNLRSWFWLYLNIFVKISVSMCLTFVLGITTVFHESEALRLAFVVLFGLQGVFMSVLVSRAIQKQKHDKQAR